MQSLWVSKWKVGQFSITGHSRLPMVNKLGKPLDRPCQKVGSEGKSGVTVASFKSVDGHPNKRFYLYTM